MAVVLTGGRTLLALVTQKLITLWLGPAGLAQMGQFQTVWVLFQSLAIGGGRDGLVKLTAEQETTGVNHSVRMPLAAFSAFTLIAGALLSVIFFILSPQIIDYLELPSVWLPALRISALLIFFSGPSSCLQSYFMGRAKWRSLAGVQAITALSPLLVLGALYLGPLSLDSLSPLVFSLPPLITIMCLSVFNSYRSFRFFFTQLIDLSVLKKFWPAYRRLAVMALPGIAISPISLVLVRQILAAEAGWEITGLYQALLRMFDYPILLFTSFLSLYYLPALGRNTGGRNTAWKHYTWRAFGILCLLTLLMAIIGPVQRPLIATLYTREVVVPDFWYYCFVLNTFLKLWVWLLCMQLLITEAWKAYWIVELVSAFLWISLSAYFVPAMGVNGILLASLTELIASLVILYLVLPGIKRKMIAGKHTDVNAAKKMV